MKSNKLMSHNLMLFRMFYVAEGKDIACRHFYDKTGQLENDHVQGAPVILDRSKPGSFLSDANHGTGDF